MKDKIIAALKHAGKILLYTFVGGWLAKHGIAVPDVTGGAVDPGVVGTAINTAVSLGLAHLIAGHAGAPSLSDTLKGK